MSQSGKEKSNLYNCIDDFDTNLGLFCSLLSCIPTLVKIMLVQYWNGGPDFDLLGILAL
jgi:hypothetical protein